MADFSEKLLELRQEKGLSQDKLAKATGISNAAIANWELKKRVPSATHIIALAKFFGCTADYLLGLDEYK